MKVAKAAGAEMHFLILHTNIDNTSTRICTNTSVLSFYGKTMKKKFITKTKSSKITNRSCELVKGSTQTFEKRLEFNFPKKTINQ